MVTIPSGSFFLSTYLNKAIDTNNISENELSIALALKLPKAYKRMLSTVEYGSSSWLLYAQKLALVDGGYALKLASFYQIEENTDKAIFWYKKAIKLNQTIASIKLAEYYFEQGKYEQAKSLLVTHNNKEALSLLVEIAIIEGDIEYVKQNLPSLKRLGESRLLRLIDHYEIINVFDSFNQNGQQKLISQNKFSANNAHCENSVQLLATNLDNLQHAESLIHQAERHALYPFFCFEQPKYIPKHWLVCNEGASNAIECDESILDKFGGFITSRYVGFVLDQGGANVNNGIMYLDRNDNVNVFTHELSHLLGFVDEYALPKKHRICQSAQSDMFSHNVVVLPTTFRGNKNSVLNELSKQVPWWKHINNKPRLVTVNKDEWRLDTSNTIESISTNTQNSQKLGVGLYLADTCHQANAKAYKPILHVTQLQYNEEAFPSLYLALTHENTNRFSMPSFHYNVAKALINKGQDLKGMKWLSHALSRERIGSAKYQKIKQGDF